MIHKYLHFARHSLTTPLHCPSTATLLAFFAALHPTSELSSDTFALFLPPCTPLRNPSGDTFALFCRPTPPVGTLRRHFCPFLPPETSLRNPSGDTFALFRHPTPPVGTLKRHFCPFLPPDISLRRFQTTLWTTSVTLKACNQYSRIAQSAHPSHLKRHSTDNDQVTIPGVNIIAHLKVKEPSTVPPIGAPPFQVRNTTRTWNCIYPIIIKLQF